MFLPFQNDRKFQLALHDFGFDIRQADHETFEPLAKIVIRVPVSTMVVKELQIHGFKSFAVPTKIPFTHSLTAIIGPNGCGKSNILDALKWVLGEKSVKSMRGEKMEDVIFSGTATKKPANFAQVTLVLDNHDKIFDIDLEEIQISRRLYRDGQSQYMLNGTRVPRREIENLLMDTGLGKSSYSFMEQGNMDLILSSKPEDRRYIFEEAAGISRFKAQKEEALRNLENTQLNIDRISDIMRELSRELELKKKQAEKTKAYNQLLSEKKEFDLRIRFLNIKELNKNIEQVNQSLSKKQNEREKIRQKILQAEEQIRELEKQKDDLTKQWHQIDAGNQVAKEKIELLKNQIREYEKSQQKEKEQLEEIHKHRKRHEARILEIKKEQDKQKQLTLELRGKLSETKVEIQKVEKNTSQKEKEFNQKKEKLKQEQQTIANTQEAIKALRQEQAKVIQELLAALKSQKQELEKAEKEHLQNTELLLNQIHEFEKLLLQEKSLSENLYHTIQKEYRNLQLKNKIQKIADYGLALRHSLFDEGGILSQKEKIDAAIEKAEQKLTQSQQNVERLRLEIANLQEEIGNLKAQKELLVGELRSYQIQNENSIEKEEELKKRLAAEEQQNQYFLKQYRKHEENLLSLQELIRNNEIQINTIEKDVKKDLEKIARLEKKIESNEKKRESLFLALEKDQNKLSDIVTSIQELEVQIGALVATKEHVTQDLYNDYNMTIQEVEEKLGKSRVQMASEKEKLKEIEAKIKELGAVNPLAIEELENVESLYDHHKEQLDDILKAKEDIEKVIADIDETSRELFLETFEKIRENFSKIFNRLFGGGNVTLELVDPDKPLTSGIDIMVQPPGKRPRSLRLLSGGEKALTAISLMFAIYLVKSSPFCVLDEIDAPLDDHNVVRFLSMLDEFKEKTQFVLITHHKKTMAHADAIFGVTMEEPGVSKLLSVELKSA
ncbi:MAG: hypothetical protein D6767_03840 [Candidatus Hydrogenedentota bacterium]|nr:MAG: hypothetical protein D6767_03840 [Candidatus Hydrogenedentota bacterium]